LKIGLFFGSFNPIHIGHLIIANHMIEYGGVKQVWFVVSPQNPLKPKQTLLNQYDRLHLVRLAVEDDSRFHVSDIEFQLPVPSYTIDTLIYLKEKYPEKEFSLIMGSDNLESIDKWKNYEVLLRDYEILVYKRKETVSEKWNEYPHIKILDVPLLNISATQIRKMISEKKSVRYLLPEKVKEYLQASAYYKKN
jgi:nicotinate-nucleotide adenylyltransferase